MNELTLILVTGYLALAVATFLAIPLMRRHPEVLAWLGVLFGELFLEELVGANNTDFAYSFKYAIIMPSVWLMVLIIARVIYRNWPPKA